MLETTNNKDMITVVHYVVGGIAQEEETPVQPQQTTKARPKPKQTTRPESNPRSEGERKALKQSKYNWI